jgi:hypothetical protein
MKKGGSFNNDNNKPHFDKPQSRAMTPLRIASRKGQFGKPRRAIPRSK